MFLLFSVLSFVQLYGQTDNARKTVKGIVIDNSTGSPLIGVMVVAEKNRTIGTITDNDGRFELSLPEGINSLQFTYLGYLTRTIEIKGKSQLQVIMDEDIQQLSEVVVVGYGSQKKETLTGSIAVIDSKKLVETPTANISNMLVGRAPGILSNQASGEAGNDNTTIRIRGVATLNSSGYEPLIVIDGIQSSMSAMNALDANEIEKVSILKDASSTAVYGVKGANGVIIITTKRGNVSAPRINLSYRYGTTELVSKLKLLGSYEYALYRNEAITNDMEPGNYQHLFSEDELWKFRNNRDYTPLEIEAMNLTDEQKTALANSPAMYYGSHDFMEEQFGNLSPQQQYNINVSGGSESMKYFLSVGNYSQKGVFNNADYGGANINSTYDRFNFRSNIDINIFKNLMLSVDFGGQVGTKQGILGSSQDGATSAYGRHKAMLVGILAGTPYAGPGIIDDKLVVAYGAYQNPLSGKGGGGWSPIATILQQPVLKSRTSNLNSTIKLKHDMDYITEGLSVSGTISYNDAYTKGVQTQKYVPTYTAIRNPENPVEILFFGGTITPATISDNVNNSKWNQIYIEGKIDYTRTFDKHAVAGLVLYNAQKTKYPGYEYNVPAGLIGLAGRFTYTYDERYLLEFNMGYNGSENFPEEKRFGFFPAYSLGWIVTNEHFIPKNDFLTWLKIRGSYGEVGNDQIGGRRFLYLPSTWNYANYTSLVYGYYFGASDGTSRDPYYYGSYESTVGNPNVTWERAKKTNVGLDINFFTNRLSFSGDVFQEKRDNILWNLGTVPSVVAATLPPANIGKVSNKGYEIQFGWRDRISDFEYGIGGNVSYAVNKIEYMDEPEYPYEWMNTTGFSIGQYKGFKTSGFYNTWEEANNRPYVSIDGNKVQAGDIRYVDINGDGVIDAEDKVPIGFSNLPRFSFGANIEMSYKGAYISVLFTGSDQGSMPMTDFYILNPFYMTNGAALQFQYDGRWTPEKAEQGIMPTFPRASTRTYSSQNGVMNDLWLRSTRFARLKNLEIGYNFINLGILKKYGLSGIRIFANGSNLYTWCPDLISGYDPEQEDSGGAANGYLYPPTRTYNFGINFQF